ncbi:sensor histidine kinase [Spirillospora sp. NBC_01491]|uniref:sensor histidine kinase n=1 Tax=Spirillospora sp. NBC_01491 TaxID=2976007 RepID=UPI002E3442B8|nr:ATP-binding protein [Spirillospora sp. NBC_01491]
MPEGTRPEGTRPGAGGTGSEDPWPELFERFSRELLVLAEQVRPAMDHLEREEEDPDRLQALYEIDHGITRMRRRAQVLRVLTGRDDEEASGHVTSLLDIVRMAESSIEQYTSVAIVKVVELSVLGYAAEDLASLVAALLDNATRYSPAKATVSAHLLDSGAVMLRIEDTGIGMAPGRIEDLNRTLAGPVPAMTPETSRHTGFPAVHRLARRHGVGVRLDSRPARPGAAGGTIAMVTVPAALLCEAETPAPARAAGPAATRPVSGRPEPRSAAAPGGAMPHLTMAHRAGPARPEAPEPAAAATPAANGLPRRQRTSLRPVKEQDAPAAAPVSLAAAPSEGRGDPASPASPAGSPAAPDRSFAADLDAFTTGARRLPDPHAADNDPEGRP